MDRLTFRNAIARHMGHSLTPELCALIEVEASRPVDRSIDLSQFLPYQTRDYVLHVERFAAVLPELIPLHETHWLETEGHRHGLPLAPRYDDMAADDLAGQLLQFTVRRAGALVGHLRLYVRRNRHTSGLVALEDTLFVLPEHRTGILGLKLLNYAEDCLRRIGVETVEANSKMVNKADVLLKRMGYEAVAIQFHKIIKE